MVLKKATQFIVLILLFLYLTSPVYANSKIAENKGTLFGLRFSIETISQTNDINGGSYFYLNPIVTFNQRFSINLRYSTNIAPWKFSDHLFSITPQFNYNLKRKDQYYFGPTCLITKDNAYYGLKFAPFFTHNEKMVLEMMPISFLY